MPSTLFYSWQSDLPNNLNRGLIRRAIDDAVAELNKDVDVEDAIRVDQDTQDEPGTPPIPERPTPGKPPGGPVRTPGHR